MIMIMIIIIIIIIIIITIMVIINKKEKEKRGSLGSKRKGSDGRTEALLYEAVKLSGPKPLKITRLSCVCKR